MAVATLVVPEDEEKRSVICLVASTRASNGSASSAREGEPSVTAGKTLLMLHRGSTYPMLERLWSRLPGARVISQLGRFLEYRRNPRSSTYVIALVSKHAPHLDLSESGSTFASSLTLSTGARLET